MPPLGSRIAVRGRYGPVWGSGPPSRRPLLDPISLGKAAHVRDNAAGIVDESSLVVPDVALLVLNVMVTTVRFGHWTIPGRVIGLQRNIAPAG